MKYPGVRLVVPQKKYEACNRYDLIGYATMAMALQGVPQRELDEMKFVLYNYHKTKEEVYEKLKDFVNVIPIPEDEDDEHKSD